jgi:D-inositol-3-phosphate glycosyltransferase
LKIIIVGPAYPLRGGIADFNEALAKTFIREGYLTELYSFYYQYPPFLFPGKSQVTTAKQDEKLEIHSTISSVNPLSWYSTASKIIGSKPDLVLIRYWLPFMAPALGTIAKKLRSKKIPVIAITDNVIPHEKRAGDNLLTTFFVRQCDGFVTLSASVLEDLSKFTSEKRKVFLPHPVYDTFGEVMTKENARNELGLSQDEKIILFFGFIRKYKGLDLLIEAMKDERLRKMNVTLLIAGEFYDKQEPYLKQIADSGTKIILHADFIRKENVSRYFCAADIVVQPYRTATQSGITQIAYHFGRPMLVTNVGGLSEIVEHGRVGYVTERNPTAIADAIFDFYEQGKEEEFSRNVITAREKFSWKAFSNGVLELLRKVKSS